jgi:Na+/melibiose symporter-like transporter
MLAVLRRRNYALLWSGQFVSMIGDWMLFVALPMHVYTISGSALLTGLAFAIQMVPPIVLGSLAGVFVDRWDRRRTMIVGDILRAVVLLALLLVRTPDTLWIVYLVALVQSTVSRFYGPANNALIPHLVEKEQLDRANALDALGEQSTRLVGPALGGVLFSAIGMGGVVVFDSVSFLVSALAVILIRLPVTATHPLAHGDAPAPGWLSIWRDWLAGLRVVAGNRTVTTLFLIVACIMVSEGILSVLMIVFVKRNLGGGATEFGLLLTSQAIGGLIAGALAGWMGPRLRAPRLIALCALLDGVLLITLANTPILVVDLALLALAGLPVVWLGVTLQTTLQLNVTDAYRGRVFGALATTQGLVILVTNLLTSSVADRVGAAPIMTIGGCMWIVAALVAVTRLKAQPAAGLTAEVAESAEA